MQENTEAITLPFEESIIKKLVLSLAFSVFSFAVPFFWGHPQITVGSFVNFLLFAAASFLPFEFLIPVALMPSISVLARGMIFGPFTWALVYMLPFIWIANLAMCWVFRRMGDRGGVGGAGGIAVAVFGKTALLFLAAWTLFNLNFVPKIFLTNFGVVQFITAVIGGGGWILFKKIFNFKF